MAKDDLMEHATSNVDFYELLNVQFETSESDIRRAYRKTALKYHPDKLGKDFDPEKFHLLQIANDVLSDPAAKAAYDNARNAKLQKQRQNELFEGKRKQMKDELEARERGGSSTTSTGVKRPREDDEMDKEILRLAEEGKRRRREMENKMKSQTGPIPTNPTATAPEPEKSTQTYTDEPGEEDEVDRLERMIREAEIAKAKRKLERKARKSGVFVTAPSPSKAEGVESPKVSRQDTSTPIKRPDLRGTKADDKSSASPRFSFSPRVHMPEKDEFANTMARLKVAEKQRLEDEIRRQEAATGL